MLQLPSTPLLTLIRATTQSAMASGALQPLPTRYEMVKSGGIEFVVRVSQALVRKQKATQTQKQENSNPFLPYETDLFVADISDTHLCLLNKFNVVADHVLIVTRQFVSQETWLDAADFLALLAVLAQFDGLGFFNGGAVAGASQPHKHLQIVPRQLAPELAVLPIDPLLDKTEIAGHLGQCPLFPFAHAIAKLPPNWWQGALMSAAEDVRAIYGEALVKLGMLDSPALSNPKQSQAYNLLMTREWLLLIPRTQEHCAQISVNSLGFVGSLFARNDLELSQIRELGPMTILKTVAQSSTN